MALCDNRPCRRPSAWRFFSKGGTSISAAANEVTTILAAIRGGDEKAANDLLPVVYGRLRRLAQQMLAQEKPGQTLQATALVHEAYLRLLGDNPVTWEDRRHFYGAAALAMRRILVERARRRGRLRHGGGRTRVDLDDVDVAGEPGSVDVVAVDEELRRLEKENPRVAQVVMLRFYAGLCVADTAKALDISPRTVRRDWTYAKAYLYQAVAEREP